MSARWNALHDPYAAIPTAIPAKIIAGTFIVMFIGLVRLPGFGSTFASPRAPRKGLCDRYNILLIGPAPGECKIHPPLPQSGCGRTVRFGVRTLRSPRDPASPSGGDAGGHRPSRLTAGGGRLTSRRHVPTAPLASASDSSSSERPSTSIRISAVCSPRQGAGNRGPLS